MMHMLSFFLFLIIAASCRSEGVPIVVTNVPPSSGFPREAYEAGAGSGKPPTVLGSWGASLTNAVQVTIRYYDKRWAADDKQATQRLDSLFRSDSSKVKSRLFWEQPVLTPSVEGTIRYNEGKEERFMIWGWVGCFEDSQSHWLFLDLSTKGK